MRYVDGFLLPVAKKNLQVYRRIAQQLERSGASTARSSIANAPVTTST
jgi:uncharacterized protein YbaA (DUF1428 family)